MTVYTIYLRLLRRTGMSVLLIIGLILFPKPGFEAAWRVGGGPGMFLVMGNLELEKPVLEYELFLDYENKFGGIYQTSITRSKPDLKPDMGLTSLELTGFWLQRSARFKVWLLTCRINAGPGITTVAKRKNGRKVVFGSFSFRSDVIVETWEISIFTISTGVTFRGCALRSSGWYCDRFGFTLVISG